jgi:hypothetical protein
MFIKRENKKGDRGTSLNFQSPFDEFLKKGINPTFKGSKEDDAICPTG